MAEEPLIGTVNSSQLLQSSPSNHSNGNNIDDLPVGGSKFNFSQFPSENDAPVQPKKPVLRKASKQSKKEQISIQKNEQVIAKNSQPLDQIPVGGNNNLAFNPFDEKPAKSGNNANMSEFPEGEIPSAAQQTNYTMTQMLKSKANKLKLSGMQALLKMLEQDENNSELQEVSIGGLLKQTVPANLQKILQCFSIWMKKGRSWGEQQIRNIIQYGHINGKAHNKKQAIQILDQIYEEKPNDVQLVLLMGFKNKIPKNIAGYNVVLNELITIYGAKKFKFFKPYISEVVRVISSQKLLAVKTQGMNTLKEACKWMTKEFIQPQLKDLKEGLKKELDSFWETYDKTIVMTAPKDVVQAGGKNQNKKGEIYNLSEAVDVFKKFSEKWSEALLKAPKWNEKTKMIEDFVKQATVIKIANTDFRPVAQVIRRLINDSNFNVVLWVLKMIAVIAKGLRKPFSGVIKNNFANIIAKFKDKKTLMIQETFKTLTDITYSIGIEQVLEDVKEGLQQKSPNMKINLINWISKYVEQKVQDTGGECPQKAKDSLKQLFTIFQKLISDSDSGVRQAMVKSVAKLQYFLDQDFFPASLKSKIKKLPASQIKPPKEPLNNLKKQDGSNKNIQVSKISSRPNLSGPSSVKGSTVIIIPSKEPIKAVKALQCFDDPTYEDSLQTLINLGYPQQQVKRITSSNANDRSLMLNYFRQNPYECLNQILRIIRKAYKDWKEVNLNLNKDLISYLQERKNDLNKPEIYVIIPYIVEKYGDNKFTEGLTNIISDTCSRLPPKYIVGHIIRYTKITQGKKPKLNAEVCSLLIKIIEIVSIINVDLRQIIQYAKQTYAVPFSKKGAASLLVFIYSFIGEEIKGSLQESTYKAMESEFKATKLFTEEQKKPKVSFEGEAAFQCVIIQKKASSKGTDKTKDISVQILRLLPKLNDNSNWQNRKIAAEELTTMLEQSGKVNFGNPTDLLSVLKSRINDPNKQLIKIFVHLAGLVLCALPQKELKNWSKNYINAFLDGLNDKNQGNKKLIHTTLAKLGQIIGKQAILSSLGPYLQGQKEGRFEVICLALNLQDGIAKADIKDYPKGLINCLTDKNKSIRQKAQKLFEKIYEKIGLQQFKKMAKNSKLAVEKDLTQFLNKFDKNASSININSRGSSPNNKEAKQQQPRATFQNQPPTNPTKSNIKSGGSISKVNSKSNLFNEADQKFGTMTGSFYLNAKKCLVEGNEMFANLKVLSAERAERVSNQEIYQWRLDDLREHNEQSLKDEVEKLFRSDMAKKMFSFDYKRVMEVAFQLIKLAKDITYQTHIRQLYDILLKWIMIRLWGGNLALVNIIQLITPMLSILQKKKLAMTEFQVDLVIVIMRQYLFSALLVGNSFNQSLYNIIKCLVTLSSGQKVLKKVLRQFTVEPSTIHKHLKKESGILYRQVLKKLVKHQLVDYVGNEDTLEEASKVKQLKQDNEFVEMLSRRLHQNVLSAYGFKKTGQNPQPPIQTKTNQNQVNHAGKNNQKSLDRPSTGGLLQRNDPRSSTTGDLRPSKLPVSNIKVPLAKKSDVDSNEYKGQSLSKKSQNMPDITSNSYEPQLLDLTIYLCPHPASPLGKQLSKLLPPNQPTIQFFNTLFQETSQKIINQLSNHAKFIFGSILKSVQSLLSSRKQYQPDRIVAQITLLQNCIKCNHVVKNIDQLLGFGTSFALSQLVYEDQHKSQIYEELKSRNIQYKSDQFIKAINGVMLRLLQFANSQDIVNVLLELLTVNSRAVYPSSKTISLIVKCLGRVAPGFIKDLKQTSAKKFLVRANEYFCSIQYDIPLQKLDTVQREQSKQKIRNQDTAANAIKAILIQLCNKMNSEIWDVYQKAMMESKFTDKLISSYLHSLNIKQPERRQKSHVKQNQQLKKINELLSKNKSFQVGISQLKKYMESHPNFNPYQYFTSLNYDQKFIAMVVKTIDGQQQQHQQNQRFTPIKQREEPQSNIQDKIQRLKQRYEHLQPQTTTPPQVNNSSMVRGRGGGQQQLREEKALQIKRRIEEMKSRMNSTINRGNGRQ